MLMVEQARRAIATISIVLATSYSRTLDCFHPLLVVTIAIVIIASDVITIITATATTTTTTAIRLATIVINYIRWCYS